MLAERERLILVAYNNFYQSICIILSLLISYVDFPLMPHLHQKEKSLGFTLLELLVVLVILGTLMAIGLRSFVTSQMKSRDVRRKSDIEQFTRALELYRNDNGYYPVHDSQGRMVVAMVGEEGESSEIFEWGESFVDPDNPESIYMAKLPRSSGGYTILYQSFVRDPSEPDGYREAESEDTQAQAYRIFTRLENSQDGDILSDPVDAYCDTQMSSSACNYVVSSSNLPTSIGYQFTTTPATGDRPDDPTQTPTPTGLVEAETEVTIMPSLTPTPTDSIIVPPVNPYNKTR